MSNFYDIKEIHFQKEYKRFTLLRTPPTQKTKQNKTKNKQNKTNNSSFLEEMLSLLSIIFPPCNVFLKKIYIKKCDFLNNNTKS